MFQSFIPSWREHLYRAICYARNVRYYLPSLYARSCYICGRKEDRIFNSAKFVPIYDSAIREVVDVCDYHGGEWFDCCTGELVAFPPSKPYWYRKLHTAYWNTAIFLAVIVRFVYFLVYDVTMWKIAIVIYNWRQAHK